MIEHFILAALAFISFLFAVDKNKFRSGIFISSALFFLLAYILVTFRAENVGNDTGAYIDYFRICLQFDNYQSFMDFGASRFEKGYATYSYLISRITDDYTVFFAICNALYLGATIYFFRKTLFNKNVWILPWFLSSMYYDLFNTLRASMAMVFIYLFAVSFLNGNRVKSIFFYILSFLMHTSALAAGVIFFLKSKYVSKLLAHEIALLVIFGCIGIFFFQFMSLLPDYYSNYYFESQYGQGGTRIASIADLIMLSSLYILSYHKSIESWEEHDFFKIMFLFAIGMSFLGLFLPSFNRVEFFFKPFMIVYVLNIFKYQAKWRQYLIIAVFCILAIYQVVAFIVRPEWLGIFPYSFR